MERIAVPDWPGTRPLSLRAKQRQLHWGHLDDAGPDLHSSGVCCYLPKRYAVDSAIVIDSNGRTSDQLDVVIYDPQYTPTLLDQYDHKYVPAEAVYAVMEVKPTVNKGYLDYAGKKAASVRRLKRTSIPIPHAGGTYRPQSCCSRGRWFCLPQAKRPRGQRRNSPSVPTRQIDQGRRDCRSGVAGAIASVR